MPIPEMLMTVFVSTVPVVSAIGWCCEKLTRFLRERNYIRSVVSQGWRHIGTVQFMCVYPIDSGRGIEVSEAYFGRYGLRTISKNDNEDNPTHFYDRCFLIYSTRDPPTVILRDQNVISVSDRNSSVKTLWNTLRPIAYTLRKVNEPNTTPMIYNETFIPVQTFPNEEVNASALRGFNFPSYANLIYQGIGYCSQRAKKEFNTNSKREFGINDIRRFNPNFSSFTMVNSKSVKEVKSETNRLDLTYKNFRPHIVFKGKRPYIETYMTALRIGDLEFCNVFPSSPEDKIDMPIPRIDLPPHRGDYLEPHAYLTDKQSITNMLDDEYFQVKGPAFGVNFESREPDENPENNEAAQEDPDADEVTLLSNIIKEGYPVFAKFPI